MKYREIKKLSIDELKNKVNSIKKDLFNMRFKKINGQLEDTSKVSQLKRDLAKILAIVVFPTPLIPVNKNALGILFNEIDFFIASTIIF